MTKRTDKQSEKQTRPPGRNAHVTPSEDRDKPTLRTRGKGTRAAKVHRTIRLDAQMAEGITLLSESWDCPESQVIRHLLRSGLDVALHNHS
jgi:hypothetical protein